MVSYPYLDLEAHHLCQTQEATERQQQQPQASSHDPSAQLQHGTPLPQPSASLPHRGGECAHEWPQGERGANEPSPDPPSSGPQPMPLEYEACAATTPDPEWKGRSKLKGIH